MARHRERGWPQDPAPLPIPVPDNHTHLEAIGALAPRHKLPKGADPSESWMDVERECKVWPGFALGEVPTPRQHLDRARAAGIDRVIQVGCDLSSARWTNDLLIELAQDPATDHAALGAVAIHPNEAVLHAGVVEDSPDGHTHRPGPQHAASLDDAIAEIAALARANERIRVIGETGIDLFRTGPQGAAVQREAFRAHIALAKELDLALQIHDRDAHAEVLDVLDREGAPERTIFHCYSGDAAMARYCADRGWYLSFAGPVTYPANGELREALRTIPLSQVLVETDAPYLPPHPFRGRPNAPYVAAHTVRGIAQILGRDVGEVCALIASTSQEVYGPW